MDFQSDTAYDSLTTRATTSSGSGIRGPRIETIFDESPPSHGKGELDSFKDLLQRDDGHTFDFKKDVETTVNIELDHPLTTPDPNSRYQGDDHSMTPLPVGPIGNNLTDLSSSPPSMAETQILQTAAEEDIRHSVEALCIDGEEDWAEENESSFEDTIPSPLLPKHSARRLSPLPFQLLPNDHALASHSQGDGSAEKRSSIFDWSEQQKPDSLHGSSPRPKTVHGKQGTTDRGTRALGRRGPSALHFRSQSVPVTREVPEGDAVLANNKYGTWGLGHKGVSEEWNDDFDFDDIEDVVVLEGKVTVDGASNGMKVPQAIIDRQASVHGQFGQVQEFMLLVEELKRLRAQGDALQLTEGHPRQVWDDAENIINLATLNDDEDVPFASQAPSSPSCFDEFEEESPSASRLKMHMTLKDEALARRNSVSRRSLSSPATPPIFRARGESLAQAKSFLQTIHQSRNGADSSPVDRAVHSPKKLPFDTQDLRDLVVRAGVVTRALKDIVRRAEGVAPSPDKTPKPVQDPPFSQIFNRPEESPSPTSRKPGLPKSRSANSYLGNTMNGGNENDISSHLQMMTVV